MPPPAQVGAAGDVEIRATGGGGGRGSSRSSSRSPRGGSRDGSPQPSAARGGYSLVGWRPPPQHGCAFELLVCRQTALSSSLPDGLQSPRTAPRTGTSPRAGRVRAASTAAQTSPSVWFSACPTLVAVRRLTMEVAVAADNGWDARGRPCRGRAGCASATEYWESRACAGAAAAQQR